MERVETFVIDPNQTIEIQVPELGKKVNYYYQPMKDLHRFDEVTIVYTDKKNEYFLGRDVLQGLIGELYGAIRALLAGKYNVPSYLKGYVGLQWDKDTIAEEKVSYGHTEFKENILGVDDCLVMSCPGENIYALMYNIEDKHFIEISSAFPWVFGEGSDEESEEPDEDYIPFEEYEKNYKPLVVAELSKGTLLDWKKKCENIFDKVGIQYKN